MLQSRVSRGRLPDRVRGARGVACHAPPEVLRAGLIGGASAFLPGLRSPMAAARGVALIIDPADAIVASDPARWALAGLERALSAHDIPVRHVQREQQAGATDLCVMVSGNSGSAANTLRRARVPLGEGPERLALLTTRVSDRQLLLACGTDARGLTVRGHRADRSSAGRRRSVCCPDPIDAARRAPDQHGPERDAPVHEPDPRHALVSRS